MLNAAFGYGCCIITGFLGTKHDQRDMPYPPCNITKRTEQITALASYTYNQELTSLHELLHRLVCILLVALFVSTQTCDIPKRGELWL